MKLLLLVFSLHAATLERSKKGLIFLSQ
uniref:Uncharacterized protein n=1 Tax=Rhizophora mucronata TaxID=61149 RepID=A0A2P2QRB3_RHIMU